MGRRGPPPKPAALKILTGNPGKRAINAGEPRPPAKAPPCPSWLPAHAKTEWRRVVKILEPLGLVSAADLQPLAAYCTAAAELRAATETLEAEGRIVYSGGAWVTRPDGTRYNEGGQAQPHPCIAQQRSAWQAIRQYSQMFGLDPSSRSRISVPPPAEGPDEFEEFLGGKPA